MARPRICCAGRLTVPRLQRALLVFRVLLVLADAVQLTMLAMIGDGIVAQSSSSRQRAVAAIACAATAWTAFAGVLAWHWLAYGRHLGNALRTGDPMWTMRHYGMPVTGQWARSLAVTGILVVLVALPGGPGASAWETAWPAVPALLLAHVGGGVWAICLHGTHLLVLDCASPLPTNAQPPAPPRRQARQVRVMKISRDSDDDDGGNSEIMMRSIYDRVEPMREDT